MESNRGESDRCIEIARECMADGDLSKAERFLHKAEKLYPSTRLSVLFEELNYKRRNHNNSNPSDFSVEDTDDVLRRPAESPPVADNIAPEYSEEQLDQVKRIQKCKDYYEILSVTKESSDTDVKKSYRKLALQLHPDKNNAPGSSEAFKAVGNAFAVLTDEEKRRKYDLYGPELRHKEPSASTNEYYYDYSHGFEGDLTPEEIFNLFFGGGFPNTNVRQRHARRHNGGGGVYHYTRNSSTRRREEDNGLGWLVQLSPLLLVVGFSILSSLFATDPLYTFENMGRYTIRRKTAARRIEYFVKEDFNPVSMSMKALEREIEQHFLEHLQRHCYSERQRKENALQRARIYRDANLNAKARKMSTPSCDRLEKAFSADGG